jgi:hypothetical protein
MALTVLNSRRHKMGKRLSDIFHSEAMLPSLIATSRFYTATTTADADADAASQSRRRHGVEKKPVCCCGWHGHRG